MCISQRKLKKFNVRKHFRNPWMTNELLTLINRKNDLYREWKSTSNDIEHEHKKVILKPLKKLFTMKLNWRKIIII